MAKNIQLLLVENVDNLGIVGDVVSVRPGYARNYLLPHGLATEPTEENMAAIAERRKQIQEVLARQRAALEGVFNKLDGFELTLERSANEQGILYGGVSQHDIAVALQAEGFTEIDDRMVRIGEQIKRLDSYEIPLQLAADLKTEIKLWVVSDKPLEPEDAEAEADAAEAPADGEAERVEPVE